MNKCEDFQFLVTRTNSTFYSVSKLKYRNLNSYFYLLMLLSGDISLNPGPTHQHKLQCLNEWNIFKSRGLHFIHLNSNSLLLKIEELRIIALSANVAIIGISESKLDESVLEPEIEIDDYKILRCDRNRHGGGVACHIRNDLSYNIISVFPSEMESVFFEILLPNSKPITVGTIYRSPNQSNFLEVLNENMNKIDSVGNKTYILGDFSINLSLNDSYIFSKKDMLKNKSIPSEVKSYYECCTFFSLHQLIKVPTRLTCNSATFIDYISESYPERLTQHGIIDVELSDHQLIFCTRKIYRIKRGTHKHMKIWSFKHYSADFFEETLSSINFPNYINFNDATEAYDNFIQRIMVAIDKVTPIKERSIKHNSQEWFHGEISEVIKNRDKLLKNFKNLDYISISNYIIRLDIKYIS